MNKSKIKTLKSKKRISICGNAFSDDVFKIDDTIIDEYENELDYKSGRLINVNETVITKNKENLYLQNSNNSVLIISKDKENSSSADERFEQCKFFYHNF